MESLYGWFGGVMHLLLNVSWGSWLTSVSGNAKLRNLTLYNFASSAQLLYLAILLSPVVKAPISVPKEGKRVATFIV